MPSFQNRLVRLGRAIPSALMVTAVFLSACGIEASPQGELGQNKQLLATCDPAAPPAAMVQLDGTGSSDAPEIVAARMAVVESVVRRTAVCSGRLKVIAFSASSAATVTLVEGTLRLDGATENARLRRVPEKVAAVMAEIRARYSDAVGKLPQTASDITGPLRVASEWQAQLGASYRLHLVVLTDGFQTTGVNLAKEAVTPEQAKALAAKVAVPALPGASVVFAGLGRVVIGAPSSPVVDGLVAFYTALCERTQASTCRAVTDYAVGAW